MQDLRPNPYHHSFRQKHLAYTLLFEIEFLFMSIKFKTPRLHVVILYNPTHNTILNENLTLAFIRLLSLNYNAQTRKRFD